MLKLDNVKKTYPGRDLPVIHGLTFQVQRGEFLYVLGNNGEGKSTLLRLIAGELSPDSGSIEVLGYRWSDASSSVKRAIYRELGFVPQVPDCIDGLSVFDHLIWALKSTGKFGFRVPLGAKVQETLDRFQMLDQKDVLCSTLSGGQKQKLMLAMALIREPQILLVDEPTGALDQASQWSTVQILAQAHRAGVTVLMATHERELLSRYQRPWLTLHQGRGQIHHRGDLNLWP